jgi:hypothetical protein
LQNYISFSISLFLFFTGASIQRLTDINLEDSLSHAAAEKTAKVRAARQLLSAITKVLILADKVVVKELIAAKDQVFVEKV